MEKVLVNVWKSTYTNEVYEMPTEWLPKFGGWELVATIEKVIDNRN